MTSPSMNPREAALAGLLHDIGKLTQRAHPNEEALRQAYAEAGRDLAGTETAILPLHDGHYTHRHALWSDVALLLAERSGLRWPATLDAGRIQGSAVRHHNPRPEDPADWILAEADRLASGLERKNKDAEAERGVGFRQTELLALLPLVRLDPGKQQVPSLTHPAVELSAEAILPRTASPHDQPARMAELWRLWHTGFVSFGAFALSPERFEQALLSLSERLLWAVPSSTIDQPDVSLHDHAHAVAAIAAALAAWHRGPGAWEVAAVKDRTAEKFRLIVLDLSGIQDALFRLAGQKGAARVLRARSFLLAETVSAALLSIRERLGLPASSVLLNAGGKAELLAPALPELDAELDSLRAVIDSWMIAHWQGDLGLILAAGKPFAARAFADRGAGLPAVRADLAAALDEAKHRPFVGWQSESGLGGTGVVAAPFDAADGACVTCGIRPAVPNGDPETAALQCTVCDAAARLGQILPRAEGFALARDAAAPDGSIATLPPPWRLLTYPARGAEAETSVVFEGDGVQAGSAVPRPRPHVPRIEDPSDPRYHYTGLDTEGQDRATLGDVMTFAHMAAHALEPDSEGGFRGRALLGVLKADVDRLGQVFARGLGLDRSPARIAALSRLLDAYFARRLPSLLTREFPETYTVYAGGDDLLLVLPWRFALPLARRLHEDFTDFAGGNPNLTLSAGIAYLHPNHPIALAAREAEEALEQAKSAGRNRLGLFGRTLPWSRVDATLELAERLHEALRDGAMPPTFLHRMREFATQRARAEAGAAEAAGWNAKWRYHRTRFLGRDQEKQDQLAPLLDASLPAPGIRADADAEIAMTLALWRNR